MNLTLVTINFNNARATVDLLRALERQTDRNFDLLVVDNDSAADDRTVLGSYAASSTLRLEIIYSDRNRGFSGGNNLAIRKALAQKGEWILLINNDTAVDADFISRLCTGLPAHSAVVGLPLDEGTRTVCAGHISWLTPTLRHTTTVDAGSETYAIGAGVAIHRDVFERIGYLDEQYFLYFEDAEYSVRARRGGIPVEFLAAPVLHHSVSATTKALGSPLLLRYHFRNMIRFNRQHAPPWARVSLLPVLAWHFAKQCAKLLIGRNRAQSEAILAGIMDGILDCGGNISRRPVIAVECESLEDQSWGMARQVRGFLAAFLELPEVQQKYDVVAYFKSRVPDEPWTHLPHVRTVIVRPFRWIPPSFSLYFYVFLPIRIWFDRPVVTYIANFMLPLIWHGRSIVMLTEDIWHEMHGTALPFKYRLAYRIFATHAAHRATCVMAISHASKQNVAELFGIEPDRIVVNELGVATPEAVPAHGGNFILYVGQGLPRRHLRETILAFSRIASRYPELTLVAIGPDKYQPTLIAPLVDETNHSLGRKAVLWSERVTDAELLSLYVGARTLIYVSDMEAFGLPPVEALSYGTPSVVMDAPVHREIFGEHVFYAASGSVDDIAAAIERSLDDNEHREAILRASESIVSRYTWKAHAERMLHSIDDIMQTS